MMGEGGGMPHHTNTVAHEQDVLRDRARVTIGDESLEVAAGSVLYTPRAGGNGILASPDSCPGELVSLIGFW